MTDDVHSFFASVHLPSGNYVEQYQKPYVRACTSLNDFQKFKKFKFLCHCYTLNIPAPILPLLSRPSVTERLSAKKTLINGFRISAPNTPQSLHQSQQKYSPSFWVFLSHCFVPSATIPLLPFFVSGSCCHGAVLCLLHEW